MEARRKRGRPPKVELPPDVARRKEWAQSVETLKRTLFRISLLDPALGGKWRDGMIRYYESRIREAMGRKPPK